MSFAFMQCIVSLDIAYTPFPNALDYQILWLSKNLTLHYL